tara:strand:+ start:71 stop:457 length:387 start_codon:yes stop_codon:yes gene_type:complete
MVVMLVSTGDQEHQVKEQQVMTLLQDNHGDLHGQVVLVQDMNQMVEILVCLVLLELYLVLVVEVHGVMVQPQDQVVVLQVYSTMESSSLVLAVEVVAVDQVVVTTVVELLMVVILVVTLQDLHSHFLQ